MSSPLPASGYTIEKVYSTHQSLATQHGDYSREGNINIAWDWWRIDESLFEVSLTVSIEPGKSRAERLEATVIARFKQAGNQPSVAREEFVRLQAPAILLPYVRETLSSLSSHGFFGPYYLPSINVYNLMQGFNASIATGARQVAAPATPPSLVSPQPQ